MFKKIQEWDERWVIRINNRKFGRIINTIFVYLTHIGSVIPWIVVCIVLFILNIDEFAAILGFALVDYGVIQFVIKLIIRRDRPYKNEKIKEKIELRDILLKGGGQLRGGGQSLPSGHVTTFTMVSLIFVYYFNNYYLLIVTIMGIVFVAYSRLYLGAHYPTDVITGVFFGIVLLFIVIMSIPVTLWILEQVKAIFFAS